ncbi:MAG: chemotaxis-specific protein-glutamate methyltransferase CheB [Methanoregulaceae archaeon]|nr:chemotaxis-specific protein-glutamate methyltransferase CheB [Methanoregulaceae archaeon]
MIRVLVIDDSLFMRTVIKDMLSHSPHIEVVDSARDGLEALKKIKELEPDVITLDIEMPQMNGLELLAHRNDIRAWPKTLMVSSLTSESAEMTRRAMELGADDFLLKPGDIRAVRGLERDLIGKITNLVQISYVNQKARENPCEIAERIVLIGASAGGPQQLDIVLSGLDPRLNAGVVVTQHMPAGGFTAALAARLNRVSPLPVRESENGMILRRGCAVVSKAGYHSVIAGAIGERGERGGKVIHSRAPPVHAVRPAVDMTFSSGAKIFGVHTVSALLSGMGNDGGEGTMAVKNAGGRTIVCKESDCLVYGMARAALKRNVVDRIVPLREMAGDIMELVAEAG